MIEEIPGGVRLHLLIQPKSSKNEIVGLHDGLLKIKLTAPPIDGRANEALIEFLSEIFSVPKRDISLLRGESGRRKTVEVAGVSAARARALVG